jgi:hypothetical protein
MGCRAFTHDRTGSNAQCGIQVDQAIPFVIVFWRAGNPGSMGDIG